MISALGFGLYRQLSILFKLVTLYCPASFASEVIFLMLSHFRGTNIAGYIVFFPTEVIFLSSIYYHLFTKKAMQRIVIVLSASLFLVALILYFINSKKWFGQVLPVASIVYVSYCMLYFYQLISRPIESKILSLGEFWLNGGILTYWTGSFVFFITINYFIKPNKPDPTIQLLYAMLNLLQYVVMGVSLYLNSRFRKSLYTN